MVEECDSSYEHVDDVYAIDLYRTDTMTRTDMQQVARSCFILVVSKVPISSHSGENNKRDEHQQRAHTHTA